MTACLVDLEKRRRCADGVTTGYGGADRRRDGVPPRLLLCGENGRSDEHHGSKGNTKRELERRGVPRNVAIHSEVNLGGNGDRRGEEDGVRRR